MHNAVSCFSCICWHTWLCWTAEYNIYGRSYGVHIRSNAHWHTQGVCTAQCCAMFLCYLEDNLVGKCTCTHMMGLNTTTAHGLCSVHIRSIHIGVHIRSSAHLHTWRGAHISSHSMSPTSAMRSRLGSSATRVERHSPKIWLLHLSPSQYSESYHTYLFFGSPRCNCAMMYWHVYTIIVLKADTYDRIFCCVAEI